MYTLGIWTQATHSVVRLDFGHLPVGRRASSTIHFHAKIAVLKVFVAALLKAVVVLY